MSRFLRLSLLVTAILLMIACGLSANSNNGNNSILTENSTLRLDVQAQPSTFTAAGQVISYTYTVKNNGTAALNGEVTVTDNKTTAACPKVNTAGNKDNKLDPTESIACTSTYAVLPTDITAGNVTSTAQAHAGGLDSNSVNTVVSLAENKVLTISVAANPTSYNQVNQVIKYTYTVKNTGTATLGQTQFVVKDDRITTPLNCGPNNSLLAQNESVQCDFNYTIKQSDMTVGQITDNATASGGGAGTIAPASVTVNNTNVVTGGVPSPSNIPKGSTVQHTVTDGEWLWQITRCYGADFDAVLTANRLPDPNFLYIDEIVTVPNAGSVSTIFGPPCVEPYTVKAGDTWDSIANDSTLNADKTVLIAANPGVTLSAGKEIIVPLNSKFYGTSVIVPPSNAKTVTLNLSSTNPNAKVQDNILPGQTIHHVFTGATGQVLTVKLTVPGADVKLAVYGPGNATLRQADTNTSFSGPLNANGQYIIDLINAPNTATKAYTLEANLTTTPPPSPVVRVADINPGAADSNPSYLSVFNSQLYFQATGNDNVGAELWKYDPGLNAASRVADIFPGPTGSNPAFLTPYGNMLYFSAKGNETDNGGVELWRFNGSATGRVTDINTGPADANPMYLTVYKNALYFSAKGSDNAGTELWKYDGAVPTRVWDINPGPGDSNPAYLAVFNDVLYFSATSNDSAGTELWKYDGTTASRAADINVGIGSSNPAFLTPFNNALYFSANGNDNSGTELWKFDGTTATRAVDIVPGPGDSIPKYLSVLNNVLYFSANGDAGGYELWKFDGTNVGRVADITVGSGNSNPAFLTPFNNELYSQANANDGTGAELWKYKP